MISMTRPSRLLGLMGIMAITVGISYPVPAGATFSGAQNGNVAFASICDSNTGQAIYSINQNGSPPPTYTCPGGAPPHYTQSTAGSDSKSLASRMSPCVKVTPSFRNLGTFNSDPGRIKLSMPTIEIPARRSNRPSASELPTKPQMPVIRSFIRGRLLSPRPAAPSAAYKGRNPPAGLRSASWCTPAGFACHQRGISITNRSADRGEPFVRLRRQSPVVRELGVSSRVGSGQPGRGWLAVPIAAFSGSGSWGGD